MGFENINKKKLMMDGSNVVISVKTIRNRKKLVTTASLKQFVSKKNHSRVFACSYFKKTS